MASPTSSSAPSAVPSAFPSAVPTGLPSGISAPPEVITGTDHGGLIGIITAFSLGLIVVSVPIRIYIRSHTSTYKMDDYTFLAASLFSCFQASAVFYELHIGFGRSEELIDPNNVISILKATYISDILYILTIALSKLSTAFLFLRLTPGRGHFLVIWSTICLSVVWALASILLVALRCHLNQPWFDITPECPGLFARWLFIGALDIITEVALFTISVYIVWGVKMPLKSKSIVVAAFGCRLPVIAIAALRINYLDIEILSADPTLLGVAATCCTQTEIGYSIMASIVPCLKTFMAPYERPTRDQSQYHQSSSGTNHKLSSLASKPEHDNTLSAQFVDQLSPVNTRNSEAGKHGTMILKGNLGKLRPEQTVYEARVTHEGSVESRSLDSGNSQRMIIKKGVEWSVDYDTRNAISRGKEDEAYVTAEEARYER